MWYLAPTCHSSQNPSLRISSPVPCPRGEGVGADSVSDRRHFPEVSAETSPNTWDHKNNTHLKVRLCHHRSQAVGQDAVHVAIFNTLLWCYQNSPHSHHCCWHTSRTRLGQTWQLVNGHPSTRHSPGEGWEAGLGSTLRAPLSLPHLLNPTSLCCSLRYC